MSPGLGLAYDLHEKVALPDFAISHLQWPLGLEVKDIREGLQQFYKRSTVLKPAFAAPVCLPVVVIYPPDTPLTLSLIPHLQAEREHVRESSALPHVVFHNAGSKPLNI